MQIDFNVVMASKAAADAASTAGMKDFNFHTGGQAPTLVAGDFVQFGDTDAAPVFVVVNRMFIWKSPQHLKIQLALDLPS